MNKKIKILIAMILVTVLTAASIMILPACDGVKIGGDEALVDASNPSKYAVYSNGGSTVVYDGKVYFINGIPNYEDPNGDTNVDGEVVKGALYSASITPYRRDSDWYMNSENVGEANVVNGEASDTHIPYHSNSSGVEHVSDFDYEELDYKALGNYVIGSETEPARIMENGKEVQNLIPTDASSVYQIKTEPVIRKKIGTAGYAPNFWIYDGRIYFATPSNKKNSKGEYEDTKTEFYCYTIETGSLNLLYTTVEANTAVPYAFYKLNGFVYLVTFEKQYANAEDEDYEIKTGYLFATRIERGKAVGTDTILEGVDSVYFPVAKTYDPSKEFVNGAWRKEAKATDFVYYVNKVIKDKNASSAQGENTYTLGMVSPTGNCKAVIANGLNREPSIKGVADNHLFYKSTSLTGKTQLEVTNLKAQYAQMVGDYGDVITVPEALKDMLETPKTIISNMDDYTDVILIEDDEEYNANGVDAIAVIAYNGNNVYRVTAEQGAKKISNGESFKVIGYNNGMVFGVSSGFVACMSAYKDPSENSVDLLNLGLSKTYSYSEDTLCEIDFFPITYKTTFAGNSNYVSRETYVSFCSKLSETAKNYLVIKKIDGVKSPLIASPCLTIGEVVIYERDKVVCFDNHCINFMHDHSSWDDLDTKTEDEKSQESIDELG